MNISRSSFFFSSFQSSSGWVGGHTMEQSVAASSAVVGCGRRVLPFRLPSFVRPLPPPPVLSCHLEGDCNSKGAARWGWRDGKMSQVNTVHGEMMVVNVTVWVSSRRRCSRSVPAAKSPQPPPPPAEIFRNHLLPPPLAFFFLLFFSCCVFSTERGVATAWAARETTRR